MALENYEKEAALCMLEKVAADAKARAGITDLGEIDTEITALRTAFDADPDTCTPANLKATKDKIGALRFDSVNSTQSLWVEIDAEAA